MATLQLSFRSTTNRTQTGAIDSAATLSSLISDIVGKLGLPSNADTAYSFTNKRTGKELHLEVPLEQQDVLDGDVLLVSGFALVAADLRSIELARARERSPGSPVRIELASTVDEIQATLGTLGIARLEAGRPVYRRGHRVRIVMRQGYPLPDRDGNAPRAAWFVDGLFHPSVHPKTGQVCLEAQGAYQADTLWDVLMKLVRVSILHPGLLDGANHLNPEAARWARDNRKLLPLEETRVTQPTHIIWKSQ